MRVGFLGKKSKLHKNGEASPKKTKSTSVDRSLRVDIIRLKLRKITMTVVLGGKLKAGLGPTFGALLLYTIFLDL